MSVHNISTFVTYFAGQPQLPSDCRHVGGVRFTEEQGEPVFKFLVEVLAHDKWRVHHNVASNVASLLAGRQPDTELRTHQNGKLNVCVETAAVDMPNSSLQETEPAWLMSLGKLANHLENAASSPQQSTS